MSGCLGHEDDDLLLLVCWAARMLVYCVMHTRGATACYLGRSGLLPIGMTEFHSVVS